MNNEWARFESFKTFPDDCPVSTLNLAKSGFYSTGNGQEAICFSCGLKNAVWTDVESVADVHRRLSPDCKFLNGNTTENVSIHDEEDEDKEFQGACGGPADDNSQRTEREQSRRHNSGHEMSQNSTEHFSSHNATSDNYSDNSSSENGHYRRHYSENIPTEEIRHFPGITSEQPKHPEYAIKSERLFSFTDWTSTNVVKPEDLAEAGFFFCGMQDLVRCFFCGGGMKSWEYGDSPWIEHARWFPTCAYLKQCKGQDFINLCQISSMTFPSHNNFQLRDFNSEPSTTVADQQITDLNSVAAKCVMDMGYTQPQVENAIKRTRQRIGLSENLKAQNLLEYLLDNSYTPGNVSTPTSTPSVQNKTPRSNTSNNTSRSNSPVANEKQLSSKEERKQLEEENRCLREQKMCKVCMDKDANIVFLPCGHLVSCVECAHALRKCAVCRALIQGTVRTYAS